VPRIERRAGVVWEGSLARGGGLVSAASSGAFADLPVSLPSRIGAPDGKTSPEELLAAAHATCLASSLAGELGGLGHPPGRLEVGCLIVMDEVASQGHQIVGSRITVLATAEGLDRDTLDRAVSLADEGCPFSALLKRGGAWVEVSAELAAG
jgi:osmotically inducible protein OsmC